MPWKDKPFGWGVPVEYVAYLPEAQDASINILRQLEEHLVNGEDLSGGSIEVGLNLLEPPSVRLASELFLRANGISLEIKLTVNKVPKPDPRKSQAKRPLWSYWLKTAKPAAPAPAEDIVSRCATLAALDFDYAQNWETAKRLAERSTLEQVASILAVMVHPPLPQAQMPAWLWLQRVQLAAAQWVANIESRHRLPLEQSSLIDILRGPIDWVMDAAVIALTRRVCEEQLDPNWLCEQFFTLLNRLPEEGYWSTRKVTLHHILILPGLDEQVRSEVQQVLEMVNKDD